MDEQNQSGLRQRTQDAEATKSVPEEQLTQTGTEAGELNEYSSGVADGREGEDDDVGLMPSISLPDIETKIEAIAHWAWTSVSFDTLPVWLRDNEYLQNNHRPPMYSFSGCIKSLFRMHTETWNIWTHLLAFIFFLVLCMGVYIFGDYITWLFEDIAIHSLPWVDQVMLLVFFFSAMTCLCCSFMFHLFSNHSNKMHFLFSRLDFSGIALLITGSNIPAYYYGFYCTSVARYVHISAISILGAACICVSLWKKFGIPKYRFLRFCIFGLFALYGVIPGVHVLLREGYFVATSGLALWGLVLMAFLYICGGGLYVLRIPERFFPGRFDIWASSHQLFHLFVISAALVHYDTLLSMVKYRLNFGGCLPIEMLAI